MYMDMECSSAQCTSGTKIEATIEEDVVTPQIGVLCIDVAKRLLDMFPRDEIRSYIPVSYVKFLENSGAQVVPVWIGRERAYYEKILTKLNGLLIPGGAVNFIKTSEDSFPNDCVEASKFIYEIGRKLNDEGIYFPIWGTCLGFQLIIYHTAEGEDNHRIRGDCEPMDCCLPINFASGFRNSKMFLNLTEDMKGVFETEPFGYHYHRYCITQKMLVRHEIDKEWKILATNEDAKGLEFISFIEHTRYPFYGSQVHLERIAYELLDETHDKCVHTEICKKASQYFASFFVSECRKCPSRFNTKSERVRHSIKNFSSKSTKNFPKTHWLECYLFDQDAQYPEQTAITG